MSSEQEIQARIAHGLRDLVPGRDVAWLEANRYLTDHLSTHAAEGQVLHELLDDPGYLAAAEPTQLSRAAGQALYHPDLGEAPAAMTRAYLRLGPARLGRSPADRLGNLSLCAQAEEPNATELLASTDLNRSFSPRWQRVRPTPFNRVLEGHTRLGVGCGVWGD